MMYASAVLYLMACFLCMRCAVSLVDLFEPIRKNDMKLLVKRLNKYESGNMANSQDPKSHKINRIGPGGQTPLMFSGEFFRRNLFTDV